MSATRLETPVLEGAHVRLEPLALDHEAALWEIAKEPDIWRWTSAWIQTRDDLRRYLETALAERDEGRSLPFATLERSSGRVVGCTRFGTIELEHRRVEIGWTWIGKPWQRTAINTEAKYLMLRHAFEVLGCQRVELKINSLNQPSRAAILRLGAKEEGTLRKHQIGDRGDVRDTVYFSILDEEWPSVRQGLEAKMQKVYA